MYSTGPDSDASAPASSRSVDLPTPGSPASSTTAPGTSPPPRTRSSSSSPVGRTAAARESTSVMGTAGAPATTMTCAMLRTPGPSRPRAGVSSTVPHAWHPPQRPDHFVVRQPHSAQRYIGPVDDFPMPRTVTMGCDTPGDAAGGIRAALRATAPPSGRPRRPRATAPPPGDRAAPWAAQKEGAMRGSKRRSHAGPASLTAGPQRAEERFRNICGHLRFLNHGGERLNSAGRIS
jgi:hypothetical protein